MTGHIKPRQKIFRRGVEKFDFRWNVLEKRFVFASHEEGIGPGDITTSKEVMIFPEQLDETGQARAKIIVAGPSVMLVIVNFEFDRRNESPIVLDDENLRHGTRRQQLVHEVVVIAIQIH